MLILQDLGSVDVCEEASKGGILFGDLETHHRDDMGDAITAVDDSAGQRPLAHLSGRPGGC